MALWNLGSINADHFYAVPHLPAPGETLAAGSYTVGLGGKGANQSVAAARAGAEVHHIGAIGRGDAWVTAFLGEAGVDCAHVAEVEAPTGHAVIYVAADGENAIVILAGANAEITEAQVHAALAEAAEGDILLLQNETGLQVNAAEMAAERGMRVFYSAAPFSAEAVQAVLPYADTILLNAIEARQLEDAIGAGLDTISVPNIVVTRGADGAVWQMNETGSVIAVESPKVEAVDTTGAGDTFAGYLAAGISDGLAPRAAMERAVAAAALKVTRHGTANAIPTAAEVAEFVTDLGEA